MTPEELRSLIYKKIALLNHEQLNSLLFDVNAIALGIETAGQHQQLLRKKNQKLQELLEMERQNNAFLSRQCQQLLHERKAVKR
jgi:hypothetical protein